MGQVGDRNNSGLDRIIHQISFHPDYLRHFLKTQHFLLRGDGPLPYDYRHYIAIMASARHRCTYLVNLHKREFVQQSGNPHWLSGLKFVPKKLRDLNEVNKILAHRPWLLNKSHIEKLAKGKDNWSIGEVVHGVVLLAHFHCLCSFVFGSGIFEDSETSARTHAIRKSLDEEGGDSVEELMEKMKNLVRQRNEPSDEELLQTFVKVEKQNMELVTGNEKSLKCDSDILKFIDDPNYMHEDFAKSNDCTAASAFRIQDCSWDDHAYSLLNRFYSDVGTVLDEKFKVAYDLTYYTMGHKKNVDTTIFRRAIWNYIHCIFGIRHDDYNYDEVNELLERNLQAYVKTVCCYPEQTSKKEYENVMREFRHSEKVHVNLMIFEARLQAELLYALSSIMQYMT